MRPPLAASAGCGLPKQSNPAVIKGKSEKENKRMSRRLREWVLKKLGKTTSGVP
jgi:hypothetical protein